MIAGRCRVDGGGYSACARARVVVKTSKITTSVERREVTRRNDKNNRL